MRTVHSRVCLATSAESANVCCVLTTQGGCGQQCTLQLDPRLLANDGAVLHESTHLLRAYVAAITEGAVRLELRIVRGCGPCMPFTVLPDASGCGLANPGDAFGQVWWFGYRVEKQAGSVDPSNCMCTN